jgi:glycosyltransferase involved in cell wall biosynthesis
LARFGLEPGKYILQVSRLVPEKRQLDLVEAFVAARLPGWRLAIVGDTEFEDGYSRAVKERAAADERIVCTGFQTGPDLRELYRRAGMFVLPSSHEGLPIALLEAISYCIPVLASDIAPNRAVGLEPAAYFELGNTHDLLGKIRALAETPPSLGDLRRVRDVVAARHDWDAIARATLGVYRRARES